MPFVLVLIACLLSHPLWASGQTVNISTGAVDGRVTDDTEAALVGVAVTLSGDAIMRVRRTLTDRQGNFRFPAVPPGDYKVAFVQQHFDAVEREVHIGVGFTATIDIAMSLAALQEQVHVRRQAPIVDRQSTAIATGFDVNQLANLPGARNMSAILTATPAVQVSRFDVGGNTAGLGLGTTAYGISANNRPMVEGIDATGVQNTGFIFDYGSLQEVLVSTAAHPAEWPKPGVQTQFIAKSGGDQYHGTFYADYENRSWQSFNIDDDQIARGAPRGAGSSPRESNRLWRYYDVNADIGGFLKRNTLWWYSSFRDQDVAARYVNFPVGPHRTRVTNYSGKGTYQLTLNNKLTVYGQAGRNHQPNKLDPSDLTGLNATTAINESEESTTEQLGWGWVLKGEWTTIVNSTLFVEARAGQFGTNREEHPNGSSSRVEDVNTLVVRGGTRDYVESLRREQVFGSLSYFRNGWAGTHQLKGGGEAYRTTQANDLRSSYPGDVLHVVRNNVAQEVYLFEAPSRSEAGFWAYAAYGNDSWRLNDRVTMNVGVRFDRYRIFLPAQTHPVGRFNPTAQTFAAVDNVIDWNAISPRLGVIVDPVGGGRTVLKASYSQYAVAPGVVTGFNANPNSDQWWRRHRWSDFNSSGVWEPGEEIGPAVASRGGAAVESLDPRLELPFVREVTAAIERALPANVAVHAGVVWRGERQHFLRQNANWPLEAFTVPVRIADPGPDGTPGNSDDGSGIDGRQLPPTLVGLSPVNIVRNVPNSDSNYWTLDLTATRRFTGRWSLVAGFAHTWNRDQANAYFGQSVRQNFYPLTPNDFINAGADGRYAFTMWSGKIHGTYQAPWDVRITPLLRLQSGQPFGRTFSTSLNYGNNVRILAEPLDARRMDNVAIQDLRLEKGLRLRSATRLALFVDFFNVFNANPEQNTSWSSGSFLRPLNVVAPRILRIGAKVDW